jgi:chromosome partitioning protein
MQTVTVVSRKGGSGKTTVAMNLALAARRVGLKVVLADLDPLQSASELVRSRSDASSLVCESSTAKLFVLQDACRQKGCDLLVVDTPAAPDVEILSVLNVSDFCLAVARPTALDIAAIGQSTALMVRAGCRGLVVLNQCPAPRYGHESPFVRQALETLQFCRIPIARSKLRSRAVYQHAFAHRQGVTEWEPDSEAASDVLRLLAEICDRLKLQAAPAGERQLEQAVLVSPVHDLLDRVSAYARS